MPHEGIICKLQALVQIAMQKLTKQSKEQGRGWKEKRCEEHDTGARLLL